MLKVDVEGKPVVWHQRRLVPLPCTFAGVKKKPRLAEWLRLNHSSTAFKNYCRATQRTLNIVKSTAPQAVEDMNDYLRLRDLALVPEFLAAVQKAGYQTIEAWVATGAKLSLFELFMVYAGFTDWDAVIAKTYTATMKEELL